MSKKITALFLSLTISVLSLSASGADIVYHQTPVSEMVLEAIPGVNGKSGILLGYFSVIASNNSTFDINFSRPDVYKDVIFVGNVDNKNNEELTFDLFYTWDGDTRFRYDTYDSESGINIKVAKQNGQECFLKIYLKVDKDITKLNGIYKLESGTLPKITVDNIYIKDRNFKLTVNGIVQTNDNKTKVNITGSTPHVNTENGMVPGVSTDKNQIVNPVNPILMTDFIDPYTGTELDQNTYNLDFNRVLASYGKTSVTQIRFSVINSDGSSSVKDYGNLYRYQISISSGGALTDADTGNRLPYSLITEILSYSDLTLAGNETYYVLSDLKTFGIGKIGVYFSFSGQNVLLNAPAGTYTDTITVTVTSL